MSDTIKAAIISALITALIATLTSVLIFFLGNFSTQATLEKNTVETLSEYFDSVDKDMSYKKALQTVYEESKQKDEEISILKNQNDEQSKQKDKEISILKQQNRNFENQISKMPNFEFKNPVLIADGLKVQDSVNKSIIVVDNDYYYSEGILNLILKNMFSYDASQNTVFYNATGNNIKTTNNLKNNWLSKIPLYIILVAIS